MATPTDIIRSTFDTFADELTGSLPDIFAGLVFLVVAYVVIRVIRTVVRVSLSRAYPTDQQLIVDFVVIIVSVFLWFGAALVFLDVVGMGAIAASLGTATGFVALGVAYALSEMIEDTVAGIYLLKDPDFNPGDTVTAAGITGTVTAIGLRKSRFELSEGEVVVVANRDVESKWTKDSDGSPE